MKNIMDSISEVIKELNSLGYSLEPFKREDEKPLYEIFRQVVDSKRQFPYACNSIEEFHRRFFDAHSQVYVCRSMHQEVIGGFYIKPNSPDKTVANAAYMIQESYRGQGIGTLLVRASLCIAKDLGFQGMQFNRVFRKNATAVKLYQKLGFSIIETLPDAIVMFRTL